MARPIKDGVDYFPKNTDFYIDDKVRLLRARFGAKGMYLLDYLLCDIYGKNGYFIEWNENKCFLVSDGAGCGCDSGFIKEFITGCLQCSFFNERVFKMFGVLTSEGIQRRYIRMFNSRDEIQIIKEYWLLDLDNKKDVPASVLNKLTLKSFKSTENPDKSTENPDKSTENPQNKLNKNKGKKSNEISPEQDELDSEQVFISLPLNDKSLYLIYDKDVAHWVELYPAANVKQELRKMLAWCEANPKKRKTRSGILRFIVRWLSKAQDEGNSHYNSNTNYRNAERYGDVREDNPDDI